MKLVVFDRGSGGVVCATTHLTDFALVSDVLARPDRFFESVVDLGINAPRPMSLEELL